MLGGLLTLLALALGDVVSNRSAGSVRNLLFVLVTGTSCVIITGLPEVFFPDLPEHLMMVLKVCLGPLAGAMAVYFLGIWLGGMREDPLMYRLTAWGGALLFLCASALALLASQIAPEDFHALLWLAAGVNMVPVLIALVVVARSAVFGDPLARWMLLAILCLGAMVSGLYLRGLQVAGFGLGTWVLTALCTVAYFQIAILLVLLRNRQNRMLKRLLDLELGADPATGLPTGADLLSKVEHAFWSTARRRSRCTVICVYLSNLYELTGPTWQGVEHQILAIMAARIRRAAGFRCVVGLYHPRCFVVVVSRDQHNALVSNTVAHLQALVMRPLPVVGEWQIKHSFLPRVGTGVVSLDPTDANPMSVLNAAEQKAQIALRDAEPVNEQDIPTAPIPLH